MNVIVLTTGLSGSSLITGLIAKSGYWAGDETVEKNNSTGRYETFENAELVELNDTLIRQVGFEFSQTSWYEPKARKTFDEAFAKIDPSPYREFLEACNRRDRWIWKDPKLWFTIGFWEHLIDRESTRIITISRNSLKLWLSQTSKRIIYDYGYLKRSEMSALESLRAWLDAKGLQHINVEFEQFLSAPADEIERINRFLDSDIDSNIFDKIYNRPHKAEQIKRHLLAWPIYLKNYSSRIR